MTGNDRGLRYQFLRRFRALRRIGVTPRLIPEGRAGIMLIGHRDYVGGMWDEIGQLQFDFLVSQGLTPEHVFLDVACGSLRGGVHFIDYLNPGKYLGIEKEKLLIKKGIENELAPGVLEAKRPEFVASDSFEFERFSKRADYSLAQSLFTHLNSDDLALCLSKLRANVNSGHELYATFGPGASDYAGRSHALGYFQYSTDQLSAIGLKNGWRSHYIGDWGHPRGQMMMQFVAD